MNREDRILVVDDEENMRHLLSVILEKEGYHIDEASNGKDALQFLDHQHYDFILTDIRMPKMNGLEFLENLTKLQTDALCIVMSAYGNVDTAIEAMKKGAYDYISKPFKPDEVILTLRKAGERQKLYRENKHLKYEVNKVHSIDSIISKSPLMLNILRAIEKISEYKTTILITGESGTGKELVARAVHQSSPRSNQPFVAINCGALPEHLLESELFGHVKGAFTGASSTKKGLFEEAHMGTIFLDEIGELPYPLQVKLLRVLQEDEIRKVGDTKNQPIDTRVVAATIRNLEQETKKGNFREDLFYRLNVLPIHVPPLRDRKEDIVVLVEHFINQLNEKFNLKVKGISQESMDLLYNYSWPGNVRELENTIERAIVLTEGTTIEKTCLPPDLVHGKKSADFSLGDDLSIKKATKSLEKNLILKALDATKGNRTRAAKLLEISHRALLYKMKEYEIEGN